MKMCHLLVLVAILVCGCGSTNVNRHLRLLAEIHNDVEPNVIPSKHSSKLFVALINKPEGALPHEAGVTLELNCEALGSPAPTIHWFKNDAPVYEHGMESNDLINKNPLSLARIKSTLLVTKTEDRDMYTCVATAGSKTAKSSTIVYRTDSSTDLSERSKLIPLAPRILLSYKVYIDTIGSVVVLPCHARGHPRPVVTWFDNKGAVVKNNHRIKTVRSGELVLTALHWADMGQWTCRATNAFGTQQASTFLYPAKAG